MSDYSENTRLVNQNYQINKRKLLKELDFSIITLVCGCGFWFFAMIWFNYGQISNIFLAVFLILFGSILNVVSLTTGIWQYQNWTKIVKLNQTNSYHSFSN